MATLSVGVFFSRVSLLHALQGLHNPANVLAQRMGRHLCGDGHSPYGRLPILFWSQVSACLNLGASIDVVYH